MTRPPLRRAFTLIELLVVIFILTLVASFAIPNLLNAQQNAKGWGYEDVLASMVGTARQQAIVKKQKSKLKVSGQAFEVVTVDSQNVENSVRTENFAPGVSIGNLSSRGEVTTDAEWALTFYPDGRTEQAAIEISESGRHRTMDVFPDGRTTWRDGTATDTSVQQSWGAGNLEQRTG